MLPFSSFHVTAGGTDRVFFKVLSICGIAGIGLFTTNTIFSIYKYMNIAMSLTQLRALIMDAAEVGIKKALTDLG
jgi:hypothetical protein